VALAQQRCPSPLETSKLDLPPVIRTLLPKAGPILDLYQRVWQGAPLRADDYVLCADEKTSIQARRRKQPPPPPAPNRLTHVEHEYFRMGAWTCLAAWDVHRARVFGRCEVKSGIAPVDRLVSEVMGFQDCYGNLSRCPVVAWPVNSNVNWQGLERWLGCLYRSTIASGENALLLTIYSLEILA
jgi:hypothetical protein